MTHKFKAGDKVRCMHLDKIPRETNGYGDEPMAQKARLEHGKIYTINHVDVQCDGFNDYINLEGSPYDLCPDRFELVEEEKVVEKEPIKKNSVEQKFGFRVGDVVEIKPERKDAYAITTAPWQMTITSFTEKKMYVAMPDEHPEHPGEKYEVHPRDFQLAKKQNLVIVDDPESDSLPLSMATVLGEQQNGLAELRRRAMDAMWRDEMVSREQHFFTHWLAMQEVNNDELLLLL